MKMIKDYLFYTSTNDFPIITTGEFFILHRRQTAAADFKILVRQGLSTGSISMCLMFSLRML